MVISNPLDYQMFDWNNEERLTGIFSAFLSEQFDICLSVLDYPRSDRCDSSTWGGAQRAFIRAARKTGKAAGILAIFTDTLPEVLAEQLVADGIVPLAGVTAGLAGIQAAVDAGVALRKPVNAPLLRQAELEDDRPAVVLDEAESKRLLASYGLPVPAYKVVDSVEEAVLAAEQMGFPVVVKTLGVAHKTDVGGVVLNLDSAEAVSEAVMKVLPLADQLMVEKMVDGAITELIVGVVRDEQFGPHLVVGGGGIFVELKKDSKSLLLPVRRGQVLEALEGLNCAPLFHGYRGNPPVDLAAAADAVLAIAAFTQDHISTIAELDVNPLMLLPEGQGVMAADALISMHIEK